MALILVLRQQQCDSIRMIKPHSSSLCLHDLHYNNKLFQYIKKKKCDVKFNQTIQEIKPT